MLESVNVTDPGTCIKITHSFHSCTKTNLHQFKMY